MTNLDHTEPMAHVEATQSTDTQGPAISMVVGSDLVDAEATVEYERTLVEILAGMVQSAIAWEESHAHDVEAPGTENQGIGAVDPTCK